MEHQDQDANNMDVSKANPEPVGENNLDNIPTVDENLPTPTRVSSQSCQPRTTSHLIHSAAPTAVIMVTIDAVTPITSTKRCSYVSSIDSSNSSNNNDTHKDGTIADEGMGEWQNGNNQDQQSDEDSYEMEELTIQEQLDETASSLAILKSHNTELMFANIILRGQRDVAMAKVTKLIEENRQIREQDTCTEEANTMAERNRQLETEAASLHEQLAKAKKAKEQAERIIMSMDSDGKQTAEKLVKCSKEAVETKEQMRILRGQHKDALDQLRELQAKFNRVGGKLDGGDHGPSSSQNAHHNNWAHYEQNQPPRQQQGHRGSNPDIREHDPERRLFFSGLPMSLMLGERAKPNIWRFMKTMLGMKFEKVEETFIPDCVQFPEKWNNTPLTGNQGFYFITTKTADYALWLAGTKSKNYDFEGHTIPLTVSYEHGRRRRYEHGRRQ